MFGFDFRQGQDAFEEDRWTTYRLIYGGQRGIPPQDAMFSDVTGNNAN
jgi:hypothetical protein